MGPESEGVIKRFLVTLFYRMIGHLSPTPIPRDTGDFRLLSPRALQALRHMRERHRFMKGLFGWVGFRQIALPYQREPRLAGRSKFTLWRLWNLALEVITSVSTAPLRVTTYVGLVTAAFAFAYDAGIVLKAIMLGDRVLGSLILPKAAPDLGHTKRWMRQSTRPPRPSFSTNKSEIFW